MNIVILEEYKHPDIVNPVGYNIELDFFYPKLNLAIEYQVKIPILLNNNVIFERENSITKLCHTYIIHPL